jgi:hypothetical protein
MRSQQTGRLFGAVAITLLLPLVLGPRAAGAADDLGTKRDDVRRQRAEKAGQLDVLKAKQSQIDDALNALDDNLAGEERLASRAARAEQQATQAATAARRAEQAKEQQISQLGAEARTVAVGLYMGVGETGLATFLPGDDVATSIDRAELSALVLGGAQSTIDGLEAARQDLAAARARADHAQQKAAKRRAAARSASQQLHDAMTLSERMQAQLEDRIDQNLEEAASLAAVDSQLSKEIQAREAALAARLRESQHETLARAAADAALSGASGRFSIGAARAGGLPMVVPAVGNLVIVQGIKVDASIAGALSRMIAAAAADGFVLGGSGYRSAAAQIAVRRNNCGPSQYDIWQKPASQCNPPAARPGTSMHELGLAVDFTCNGSLITSYSSGCYAWMRAHAPSFGFLNRPGEAWHWSPNGR